MNPPFIEKPQEKKGQLFGTGGLLNNLGEKFLGNWMVRV